LDEYKRSDIRVDNFHEQFSIISLLKLHSAAWTNYFFLNWHSFYNFFLKCIINLRKDAADRFSLLHTLQILSLTRLTIKARHPKLAVIAYGEQERDVYAIKGQQHPISDQVVSCQYVKHNHLHVRDLPHLVFERVVADIVVYPGAVDGKWRGLHKLNSCLVN